VDYEISRLDESRRGATRLNRMSNTPQGGAIEGNAADDALMVDQGWFF
jgi:hypothetical protein